MVLEVARALRSVATTSHVPIAIPTGLAEREVSRQFNAYGLFVSKGEDLNEFVGKLTSLIDRGAVKRLLQDDS